MFVISNVGILIKCHDGYSFVFVFVIETMPFSRIFWDMPRFLTNVEFFWLQILAQKISQEFPPILKISDESVKKTELTLNMIQNSVQ